MLVKKIFHNFKKTGNVLDFNSVYEKYHQRVYANIFRLVKDRTISEDLLQEVFVSFWLKRDEIKIETVGNWLFVVSYNKALSYLKKSLQLSFIQIMPNDDILNVANTNFNYSSNIEIYESQMTILNDAIGKLSEKKQEVFKLCKLKGKSYNETAIHLGISKETVKSYLKESMKSIRSHVSDTSI